MILPLFWFIVLLPSEERETKLKRHFHKSIYPSPLVRAGSAPSASCLSSGWFYSPPRESVSVASGKAHTFLSPLPNFAHVATILLTCSIEISAFFLQQSDTVGSDSLTCNPQVFFYMPMILTLYSILFSTRWFFLYPSMAYFILVPESLPFSISSDLCYNLLRGFWTLTLSCSTS